MTCGTEAVAKWYKTFSFQSFERFVGLIYSLMWSCCVEFLLVLRIKCIVVVVVVKFEWSKNTLSQSRGYFSKDTRDAVSKFRRNSEEVLHVVWQWIYKHTHNGKKHLHRERNALLHHILGAAAIIPLSDWNLKSMANGKNKKINSPRAESNMSGSSFCVHWR